MMDQVCR